MLPQTAKKVAIGLEIRQDLFHPRHDIVFIGKRHFIADTGKDDVTGAAEIHDDRYSAGRESLEYYTRAVVAQSRKHEDIGRSHATEGFCLADPATEGNSLLDSKRSCEILDPIPVRSVPDHSEVSQTVPQEGSGRAQGKITRLAGNQAADEDQLQFAARLRTARVGDTQGLIDPGLRDKKIACRDIGQTRNRFATKRL